MAQAEQIDFYVHNGRAYVGMLTWSPAAQKYVPDWTLQQALGKEWAERTSCLSSPANPEKVGEVVVSHLMIRGMTAPSFGVRQFRVTVKSEIERLQKEAQEAARAR